ncbi:hypothetical protein BT96DRAFT_973381 [Gymnopus androsaceus JB14]|uniref:Zn(2)-C6 fungal-type domain-containing protein n=1 Tax=Gymnopus androsaceus JB14 TaxID=1447944 RepID=A0A6A4I0U3_9AGAR|nr:hypothetical protein BT96DRAFT_973381 [Gymnopus androsaceus JB14]
MAQPGLALPTPLMQNQIHELAKTLPAPSRKQNSACDNCRTRKVKCHRVPGQEKFQHCQSKNFACTHYVQQATSEKKRSSTARRPRNISSSSPTSPVGPSPLSPIADNGVVHSIPPYVLPSGANLPLVFKYGFYPPITLETPTREVLSYLFAPPDNVSSDSNLFNSAGLNSPYAAWGDQAVKLEDDVFKSELAFDLMEIYFQIVHSRLPLLNPTQFRNRLRMSLSPNPGSEKPLHPALVATVIAWGTKFSEHTLLLADRQCHNGQSLMSKTLIHRARDLAEALKVHRIPTADHVVIGLLVETLQSQNSDDPSGFHGFWLTAATRHLLELQINHKAVAAQISDTESRGTLIFAWWMACICDAYSSLYYRHKPILDDDDYDIDFYTADPISSDGAPSPREQLEFLGYYRAAHSLARTARQMSRQLWRPITDADGIAFETLRTFASKLRIWRDKYLARVGVPKNYNEGWDFVTTVSCFASDAQYHVMWIVLFNALDDYGNREINENDRSGLPPGNLRNRVYIEDAMRRIGEEAVNGALRIAALTSVLTANEYLKLDPAVVEFHIIAAGSLLARLGRPEVSTCIVGLEQYSHSYEEAGDHAQDIRRTYDSVRNGNGDQHMNHMSRIIKQIPAFPSATAEPDVPPGAQEPVSPSMASFQMSGMNMDGAGSLMEVDDEMGLGAHKNERTSMSPPFMIS